MNGKIMNTLKHPRNLLAASILLATSASLDAEQFPITLTTNPVLSSNYLDNVGDFELETLSINNLSYDATSFQIMTVTSSSSSLAFAAASGSSPSNTPTVRNSLMSSQRINEGAANSTTTNFDASGLAFSENDMLFLLEFSPAGSNGSSSTRQFDNCTIRLYDGNGNELGSQEVASHTQTACDSYRTTIAGEFSAYGVAIPISDFGVTTLSQIDHIIIEDGAGSPTIDIICCGLVSVGIPKGTYIRF